MRYVTLVGLCVKGWRRFVGNVFCIFSCDAEPFLLREAFPIKNDKSDKCECNAAKIQKLSDELNRKLSENFKEYCKQFPLN